jgi:N-acetylglucosaminyldiphosphoundecaprenol N-acetyl-beta-D-mannosaminyltransferase
VGGYSPPFRPMTAAEEDDLARQINQDRPDVIWVGIGVPKQEKWMVRMRDRLDAQEPRRLLPRYLYTNPRFLYGVARQYLRESAGRT